MEKNSRWPGENAVCYKLYKYTCVYICILTSADIIQPPVSARQEGNTLFPVDHIHHLHLSAHEHFMNVNVAQGRVQPPQR